MQITLVTDALTVDARSSSLGVVYSSALFEAGGGVLGIDHRATGEVLCTQILFSC